MTTQLSATVVLAFVVFGLALVVNGVTSLVTRRIRGREATLGLCYRTQERLPSASIRIGTVLLAGTGRRRCAVDPEMNEPSRTRTIRRVVLTKPHRTHRDPGDQAAVWRRRRGSFGISAVVWLVLSVAGAVGGWGTTFVALALAAGVLSAAVVVKAQVLVRREQEGPPAR